MSLMLPQQAGVSLEGPLVVLRLGNVTVKMEHTTALQLSTWLRVKGKKAKTIAGDTSRHWSVIGELTAAEHGYVPH